jgi:hypothetical protein
MARAPDVRGGRPCHETAPHTISDLGAADTAAHGSAAAGQRVRSADRQERLRRELPGDLKDRAGELAGLPVAQVDLIVGALRASRRAGREHEQQMRQRNRGRPRDADEIAGGAGRLLSCMGRRGADGDLDATAALYDLIERQGGALLRLAVAGLRLTGYTDAEIAAGLGVTRQAIGARFGRKCALTGDGVDMSRGAFSEGCRPSGLLRAAQHEPGAGGS